jgi:hypothetical protein
MEVTHCPTEQMLADFFTKPSQGSLFRKFRDVIMGRYLPVIVCVWQVNVCYEAITLQ